MLGQSATLTNTVLVYLCICVFVYLSICVFVFVYLHVRHLGTLFLRSLYHYIFKNITHVRPICNLCVMCHVGHACHVCHICDVT